MSTNAHGRDFWVGQVWHSKDHRELWRHVVIFDLRNGKAICKNRLNYDPTKCNSRGTRISLKSLAERWELCMEHRPCSYCKQQTERMAHNANVD